ncbi:ABC transporter ATP-binding protein [Chloroflexota bacterium]
MLELIDIHTYYSESHVLHGVSLKVEKGSVVAILGRNGMGKTTIIHSIIGFNPPRYGKIIFKGREITHARDYKIPLMGIGLVPQGRRIWASLSVEENLTIAARNRGKTDAWTLQKVYSLFPVLKERSHHKGNLLSGGEQQMLAIGRALMGNPDLVLMDEPSEGLAPLIVRELGGIIRKIHQSGLSILLVEQHLNLALSVADYTYIINKGMIVYSDTPKQLDCNEEVKSVYLGVTKRGDSTKA